MAEFRQIQMSLFLILVLQFTTAASGQNHLSFTVRVGDDVTLPCENGIKDHVKCFNTTWLIAASGNTLTVFEHGKIHEAAKSRSDRLSVTEKCSLVIKKVTVEDVSVYTCRQFDQSGRQQGQDVSVTLSVVTMTEHQDDDEVTLNCSISGYKEKCGHKVKWVYQGQDVGKDNKDMKTSQSLCSASVSFTTSHYIYTSKNYEPLKCKVTDRESEKVKQFNFSPESSDEKTGEDAKTTKSTTITSTTNKPSTNATIMTSGTTKNTSANNNSQCSWWWYIIVVVGLASLLLITVVMLIRWKKTKGNKTQTDGNMAGPEDDVYYASISFTNNDVWVRGDACGEGDAGTYSLLKAPSSLAGPSYDPGDLYATIK